ncbi:hypothetical protein BD560DRAFT_393877 [Blakeslea trispora]|nr:hypothetical protein BD560DRAFT_393877 [Blakeslea trispora]
MSGLADLVDDYIKQAQEPSLSGFVLSNLFFFEDHDYEDVEQMKTHLMKNFKKSAVKEENSLFWKDLFNYRKTTPLKIRNMIFQWFYDLCEGRGNDVYNSNKKEIDEFAASNFSRHNAALDKMSIEMLKKFDSLEPNEVNVLKLAMSHVVDFMNGNDLVYKKYIKNEFFWAALDVDKPSNLSYLSEDDKKVVKDLSSKVVKALKKDLDSAIEFVLTEQLVLVKERKRKSIAYQILQTFNYMLNNMEAWQKTAKETEAQKVCRVHDVLNIFFEDSCLNVKIGEAVGISTKETYGLNEHNFSGGSGSSFATTGDVMTSSAAFSSSSSITNGGRKIDLVVINDRKTELSFCEFKADAERWPARYQQSKAIRLNQTIARRNREMYVDDDVVSFVWTGDCGKFFSLRQVFEICVCRPLGALSIPTAVRLVDDDVSDTFVSILNWKQHLLQLEYKIERAKLKADRRSEAYPSICFTVVNSKKRKTRS